MTGWAAPDADPLGDMLDVAAQMTPSHYRDVAPDWRQPPPFAVQVEAVQGCNLRCAFCGIRGIRAPGRVGDLSGPYDFMPLEVAGGLARQMARLGWNSRVEFAMHGEPTLHPQLGALVAIMRASLPKAHVMVTTNGVPWLGRDGVVPEVGALFLAGANTVAVDDYRPHRVAPTLREAHAAGAWPGVALHEYPADPAGNPHRRTTGRRLVVVEDISEAHDGTHAHLSNHTGCAAPLDHTRDADRCALPFRELSVRWDGNVALCCNDWRGTFKLGHVNDDGLEAVWNGPHIQAARRTLLAEGRSFAPCAGCTHRTYRNGLLPDKRGRVALRPPDEADRKLLADAVAGPTYTPVVLRPWEQP